MQLQHAQPGDLACARRGDRLPAPDAGTAGLAAILARRRSRREFAPRPLTLDELGALLWAGQGITSADGKRAAPSAGALYPLTLRLVDACGVWRFVPADRALAPVAPGDRRRRLAAAALGQASVAEAPAIVAITAAPTVLAGKYAARSERYCALEAGHVAQNVLLMATALGLAAVPVAAFDDRAVREVLEAGAGEVPLYLLPVGAPGAG